MAAIIGVRTLMAAKGLLRPTKGNSRYSQQSSSQKTSFVDRNEFNFILYASAFLAIRNLYSRPVRRKRVLFQRQLLLLDQTFLLISLKQRNTNLKECQPDGKSAYHIVLSEDVKRKDHNQVATTQYTSKSSTGDDKFSMQHII